MKEQIYILEENQPFKIRYINKTGDKKSIFIVLPELFNLTAEGGKWYMYAVFILAKFFVLFPIALIFEAVIFVLKILLKLFKILIFDGLVYVFKTTFSELTKTAGKIISFVFIVLLLIFLAVIVWNHFQEIKSLSEWIFRTLKNL